MNTDDVWNNMKTIYRRMGLSEEEIAHRIICEGTRIIDEVGNLDECDK